MRPTIRRRSLSSPPCWARRGRRASPRMQGATHSPMNQHRSRQDALCCARRRHACGAGSLLRDTTRPCRVSSTCSGLVHVADAHSLTLSCVSPADAMHSSKCIPVTWVARSAVKPRTRRLPPQQGRHCQRSADTAAGMAAPRVSARRSSSASSSSTPSTRVRSSSSPFSSSWCSPPPCPSAGAASVQAQPAVSTAPGKHVGRRGAHEATARESAALAHTHW